MLGWTLAPSALQQGLPNAALHLWIMSCSTLAFLCTILGSCRYCTGSQASTCDDRRYGEWQVQHGDEGRPAPEPPAGYYQRNAYAKDCVDGHSYAGQHQRELDLQQGATFTVDAE